MTTKRFLLVILTVTLFVEAFVLGNLPRKSKILPPVVQQQQIAPPQATQTRD